MGPGHPAQLLLAEAESPVARRNGHLKIFGEAMFTDTCDRVGVYFGTETGQLFHSRDERHRWWHLMAEFLAPIPACVLPRGCSFAQSFRFFLLRARIGSIIGSIPLEVSLERKYRQRGYMEGNKPEKKKDRPPESRPRQEQIGPRTPRMVGTVTRARCANCGAVLLPGFDPSGQCPRCGFELHCCKQCVHFDTGARFECTQPILERIPKKDARNDCTFYEFRTTVEKDTAPSALTAAPSGGAAAGNPSVRPDDARKAFDDLFKK